MVFEPIFYFIASKATAPLAVKQLLLRSIYIIDVLWLYYKALHSDMTPLS